MHGDATFYYDASDLPLCAEVEPFENKPAILKVNRKGLDERILS